MIKAKIHRPELPKTQNDNILDLHPRSTQYRPYQTLMI